MCLNHPSDRWSHSKRVRWAPNHAHHVVHGVQVAAGTQRHVCVDQVVYQAQDLGRQVLKGKCGFNQQKVVNLRLRENVLARFSRENVEWWFHPQDMVVLKLHPIGNVDFTMGM